MSFEPNRPRAHLTKPGAADGRAGGVFLGPGVVPFPEPAGSTILTPFPKPEDLFAAYTESIERYERLLPALSGALDELNGQAFGLKYWRIVAGPWLYFFVCAVDDRYRRAHQLLEWGGDFEAKGIAAGRFVVPGDTLEFVRLAADEPYNLQLYTKVFSYLGRELPPSDTSVEPWCPPPIRLWRRLYYDWVERPFVSRARFVLRESYFSKAFEARLVAKTLGRVFRQTRNGALPFQSVPVSAEARSRLAGLLSTAGERAFMDKMVLALVPGELPKCFLEGRGLLERELARHWNGRPRAIFSANAWYFNEPFKAWAAKSQAAGSALLACQHGGTYGSLRYLWWPGHEIRISQKYFSWGWEQRPEGVRGNIAPFPPTILIGRKPSADFAQRPDSLYVTTVEPRYVTDYPFVPERYAAYLQWQNRFLEAVSPERAARMRVRLLQESYGWSNRERCLEVHPHLRIETTSRRFLESLYDSRLYVCDHLSTTFLEALSANHPTVLFWEPEWFPLTSEAAPAYEALRQGGILFDTPEAAASAFEGAFDDVVTWWSASDRQKARRVFLEKFALCPPDSEARWTKELQSWLGGPPEFFRKDSDVRPATRPESGRA
jgi:putative transferase (TIGR04331 family)